MPDYTLTVLLESYPDYRNISPDSWNLPQKPKYSPHSWLKNYFQPNKICLYLPPPSFLGMSAFGFWEVSTDCLLPGLFLLGGFLLLLFDG